jgi:hypothetical protein
MTSQQLVEIAAPSWGPSRSAKRAREIALRDRRPRPSLVLPPRPLDLRVRRPRLGGALLGAALAAAFTLLWVFLLLGVVAPAAALR